MSTSHNHLVSETIPLLPPVNLRQGLPASRAAERTVRDARRAISLLLRGDDCRLLVVVGPCSVHDPDSALEYAKRLKAIQFRLADRLLLVMRVYFEKPRTSVGWKGFINDPYLDGGGDIATGLKLARQLLLKIADLGMPAATEFLDPIVPHYIADLVSWAAIGARTTESQTHREMASGLPMPVGFKNGTDGSLEGALNGMLAAARSHHFMGIDAAGRASVVRTHGNPHGHLVLRGGAQGPNYQREHLERAAHALRQAGLPPKLLIDCAHGNSGKSIVRQREVAEHLGRELAAGSPHIAGLMLESNLRAGRQDLCTTGPLRRGVSITDPCMGFSATQRVLEYLAERLPHRSQRHAINTSGAGQEVVEPVVSVPQSAFISNGPAQELHATTAGFTPESQHLGTQLQKRLCRS